MTDVDLPSVVDRLTLTTLGRVSLDRISEGDARSCVLEAGKPLALVTYLACSDGREATRTHLMDLLWSHLDREHAQNALRQTLWLIKSRVGSELLVATRERVSLIGQVECDRDTLLNAWQSGLTGDVVRLYTGDFFPDFADPGCDAFEEWIAIERRRLQQLFIRSAEDQVQLFLSTGRARDALVLAHRMRDAEPLRDVSWRLILQAQLALGERVGALAELDAFVQLCAAEGIEPEPATRALIRLVRNGNAGPDRPSNPTELVADLVGREREFSAIISGWESARRRRRAVQLHVVAPPGLGKTRLLNDVHVRLRVMSACVVIASARYGARGISCAFASEVAQKLCVLPGARSISTQAAATLVALNPSLSSHFAVAPDPTSGEEALRRRVLSIRELLEAVSFEQPLALLLDDLHWSDPASTRLLRAAVDGLESVSVLILTAARPQSSFPLPVGATQLPLAPLRPSEVQALLSGMAVLPTSDWSHRLPEELCRSAAGSPLLVLETLRLLTHDGLLALTAEGWQAPRPDELFDALRRSSTLYARVLQLSADEREIVLILSTAGVPVAADVLAGVLQRPSDNVGSVLSTLQLRGLVTEHGDGWLPAHDEYVRIVLEAATEGDVQRSAVRLGQGLLDRAARKPDISRHDWLLIGTLLSRGNDRALLHRTFATFVKHARLEGDRASDHVLAQEFGGASSRTDNSRVLVSSLPFLYRARLVTRQRVAAVVLLAALLPASLAVIARTMGGAAPEPDVVILASTLNVTGTKDLYEVSARDADWQQGEWEVRMAGKPTWNIPVDGITRSAGLSPDGSGWLVTRTVPDSGINDIFRLSTDGRARRVTYSPGDDQDGAWAPDGRSMVFSSARWNTRERLHLTKYDTATRVSSQMTTVDGWDGGATWSPDGSRIGFVRSLAGGRSQLCVIDSDGSNEHCRPPTADPPILLGWTDPSHWLLYVGRGEGRSLVRTALDSATGGSDSVVVADYRAKGLVSLSPDGRWVLCDCEGPLLAARRWIALPVARPQSFRTLHADKPTNVDYSWSPTSPRRPFLDTLHLALGSGPARVGSSYQLRVTGVDRMGRAVDVVAARWRSSDTSIARVDSLGVVHPLRAGRVQLQVTAGGWRRATADLDVVQGETRAVMTERWDHGLDASWIPFGDPRPRVVSYGQGGMALNNSGDRYYFSGVHSKASFSTRSGLWIEAQAASPLTGTGEWQEQLIGLFAVTDSIRVRSWDRVHGDTPPGTHCTAYIPWGSGERAGSQILFSTPSGDPPVPAPPVVATGQWYSVIVQLFPDGRCGLAIDGRSLLVTKPGLLVPSVQIRLSGRSVGTKVLLGTLRVMEGVAPNVVW